MTDKIRFIQVTPDNVDDVGFFCKKSKRKSAGWLAKRGWFDVASQAGMQTWMALDGKRQVGFIEFAPASAAWRVIDAPGHLVIHCMWVVGSAKGQGTGSRLLSICLNEAKRSGLGVAALVTTKKGWLMGSGLLETHDFCHLGDAPPCLELWAITPEGVPKPTVPNDWEARAKRFGDGMTLVFTNQCPYVDTLREGYQAAANEAGVSYREVHLEDPQEVRARAPAPYGVFSIVLDGELLAWRWEAKAKLKKMIEAKV